MGKETFESKEFFVAGSDGSTIPVHCPICNHNKFVSARPQDDDSGMGFQHVIVGKQFRRNEPESARTLTLPVRFQSCANCGYILKFLIADRGET